MQVERNRHPVVLLRAWRRPSDVRHNSLTITFQVLLSLLTLCFQEEEPSLVVTPMFAVLQWLRPNVLVFYLCLAKENKIFRTSKRIFCTVLAMFICANQELWWAETNTCLQEHCDPESCHISFLDPVLSAAPTPFPTNLAFPVVLNYLCGQHCKVP